MSVEEVVKMVASRAVGGGSADTNTDQNERYTPSTKDLVDEPLKVAVVSDEGLGAVAGGSANVNTAVTVSKCGAEFDDDDPRAVDARNGTYSSHTDVLHTIYEIAGVDSSNDSLPDRAMQDLDDPSLPPLQRKMHSPVGAFLQSERRTRLRRAAADSDFEMQQLNQQILMTNQHTNEVVAMRREQTRLKEQLESERKEIAFRNECLIEELQELQETAAQISKAEADVAILAKENKAQLQLLDQEKEQMRRNIINAIQPAVNDNRCCAICAMPTTIGNRDEMDANEMILRVAAAARHVSGEFEPPVAIVSAKSQRAPMVPYGGSEITGMTIDNTFSSANDPGLSIGDSNEMNSNKMMRSVAAVARCSFGGIKPADAVANVAKCQPSPTAPTANHETEDGSVVINKKHPYSRGMSVYYSNASTNDANTSAIILDVHLDDFLEPYYSIRLDDGREKQTDNDHLRFKEQTTGEESSKVIHSNY